MAKRIDVDDLKDWIENWFDKNRYYHPCSRSNNIPIPELYDILEQIPAANAVEAVQCEESNGVSVKTITKLNFKGIELPLPLDVDITEEELEELTYHSDTSTTLCISILLKEIEKLKEYIDKDFVRKIQLQPLDVACVKEEKMPKVIKPGKKEFIGHCSRCGCEFSYTLEELDAQYPLKYVHCPECGNEYYHPDQFNSYDEILRDYASDKQIKDLINVFEQFSKGKHIDDSDWSYHSTVSKSCPVCGEEMIVDDSVVLTSNPPQYWWRCPKCGHAESHVCNGGGNSYVTTCSSECSEYVDSMNGEKEE